MSSNSNKLDPFQALMLLPSLMDDYKAIAAELIEAKRELEKQRTERYVDITWVTEYWSVSENTARDMLRMLSSYKGKKHEIKVLTFGQKVVRYRRSDIERLSVESMTNLSNMLAAKREKRQS